MAKVGACRSSEDVPLLMVLVAVVATGIIGDAAAHAGRLNKEGCHHNRRRGGYHCHSSAGFSSRTDVEPTYRFSPKHTAPARWGQRRSGEASQATGRIWIAIETGSAASRGGGDAALMPKGSQNETEAGAAPRDDAKRVEKRHEKVMCEIRV